MLRLPQDGLFPQIKAVEDLTATDVPQLVLQKRFDILRELIDLRVNGTVTPIVQCLIQQLSTVEFIDD